MDEFQSTTAPQYDLKYHRLLRNVGLPLWRHPAVDLNWPTRTG